MKGYEKTTQISITPKNYIIVRLDGCHFHTFTHGCEKPYDSRIRDAMIEALRALVEEVQGLKTFLRKKKIC